MEHLGIKIRRALQRDAEAISKLTSELGYPTDAAETATRLDAVTASPSDLLFVAVNSSNNAVAWLQAHALHVIESGYRVEIVGLIVARTARRSGVRRALVLEAERWAQSSIGVESACGGATLRTRLGNAKSVFGSRPKSAICLVIFAVFSCGIHRNCILSLWYEKNLRTPCYNSSARFQASLYYLGDSKQAGCLQQVRTQSRSVRSVDWSRGSHGRGLYTHRRSRNLGRK